MLIMGTCRDTFTNAAPERKRNPFHGMLPGIKTIECAAEACVVSGVLTYTHTSACAHTHKHAKLRPVRPVRE